MFTHPDYDNHEGVHFFHDAKSGLQAIVAVHNTNRGPGAGGTRLWTYADPSEALTDALRLSKAMSYKNAMAGLALGGGKAVIIKPDTNFDRKALFEAYGRAINSVGGKYITAEDVGVSPEDMRIIKTQTDFVAGLDDGPAASGDPSPVTAEGVFRSLKVAVQHKLVLKRAETELNATIVEPDAIHAVDADVFSPCALGGAISETSLSEIQASIIVGAANNQLATPEMGEACRHRGILYAPDYVVNAGGIINVAAEVSGHYDIDWVQSKLDELEVTLKTIFVQAEELGVSTHQVADDMARARLKL